MKARMNVAEPARLAELHAYQILDTEAEKEFDDLVALASAIAGTPVSLISLVDKDRQWFKARTGFQPTETSLEVSFCAHAIATNENAFIVTDASKDDRFMHNQLVTQDPNIRFYAGFPLITNNGHKLGTLCVIDNKPRHLNPQQLDALEKLSRQAMKLIELHLKNRQLQELREAEAKQNKVLEHLLQNQRKIIAILGHDTRGPLYSMRQILTLFQRHQVPAASAADIFNTMQEQNTATINMIEGLVNWGSIYLEANQSQASTTGLTDIVNDPFTQYGLAAETKAVTLQHSLGDATSLQAHPEMVSFIVRNLVNNAVKYTEQGAVNVSGQRIGNDYELSVSDTGRGMSELTRKSLFKGKASSIKGTRQEKGSGLGLLLIQDFVQQIGGSIKVTSRLNKGTTISVGIPCA